MYQDDMVNEGDGCGGMPIQPKISIQSSASEPPFAVVGARSLEDAPEDEMDVTEALSVPYNGHALNSENVQRQYHHYEGQQQKQQQLSLQAFDGNENYSRPNPPLPLFQPSVGRSTSSRDNLGISPKSKSQEDYVLMPEKKKNKKRGDTADDADDPYVANVVLSIQGAMVFFCILILIAVIMTVFSIQGYVVVVVVCLLLLVSLLIGLCTFVYQVVNEDDAPRVNSKHMPRWYKTLTKIIKEEISDFQEDWRNMYNGMYLLEDGEAGNYTNDQSDGTSGKDSSKKKRKGKSAVFKIIAKPAVVFANFRRKRKEKKKQKKAEKAAAESYFPPIV
jgi:hypothetical protein